MRLLVTGATGLLGNNVVRAALHDGHDVRVFVREGSDPRPLEGLDVEVRYGELSQSELIQDACRECDAVVHSAAQIYFGWSGFDDSRKVNVEGTRNIAEAARTVGIRMVHVSTVDALGTAKSIQEPADEESPRVGKIDCAYVVSKREAEQLVSGLTKDGLDAVIVNPGLMLGPWDWKPSSGRIMLEVANRFIALAPSGGISICDVRDVARAILTAIEKGQSGRQYILAGKNMTYIAAMRLFATINGGKKPLWRAWSGTQMAVGLCGDLIGKLRGKELEANSAALRMLMCKHYYSSARAASELGYCSRPVEESARDAWKWMQEHGLT